jgi:hypothetical protein
MRKRERRRVLAPLPFSPGIPPGARSIEARTIDACRWLISTTGEGRFHARLVRDTRDAAGGCTAGGTVRQHRQEFALYEQALPVNGRSGLPDQHDIVAIRDVGYELGLGNSVDAVPSV